MIALISPILTVSLVALAASLFTMLSWIDNPKFEVTRPFVVLVAVCSLTGSALSGVLLDRMSKSECAVVLEKAK